MPEIILVRKKKELQALRLEESRYVGYVTEYKIAPECLRLFGFSNVKPAQES